MRFFVISPMIIIPGTIEASIFQGVAPHKSTNQRLFNSSFTGQVIAQTPSQSLMCSSFFVGKNCYPFAHDCSSQHAPASLFDHNPDAPNVWNIYLHERWNMATWTRGNVGKIFPTWSIWIKNSHGITKTHLETFQVSDQNLCDLR